MVLTIDVWSDIACPWCYIGKRKLERALDGFAHAADVAVTFHAFELDPSAPAKPTAGTDRGVQYAERLARKYRTDVATAQAMIDQMTSRAAEDGIEMRFDSLQPSNTFDAHRVLALARAHTPQKQAALKERLLRAYFSEGELMSDHATLARLASDVGFEVDAVMAMLVADEYADDVRADEGLAAQLGIHGVPFFVFGGKLAFSGAQPVETMRMVLERAWRETVAEPSPIEEGGEVCGPDGCQ